MARSKGKINEFDMNQTWRIEDFPPNKIPITCKWVYKVKKTTIGQPKKFIACLVV